MREHGAGIMRWIVEGAVRFLEHGGGRLPSSRRSWRLTSASGAHATTLSSDGLTSARSRSPAPAETFPKVYANFVDWCEENGEQDVTREYTSQRFHDKMDQHYARSDKMSRGSYRRRRMRLYMMRRDPTPGDTDSTRGSVRVLSVCTFLILRPLGKLRNDTTLSTL